MLPVLSALWGLLLFRGLLGVLFGIAALLWPGLTLVALVLLFGAYALVDGAASLVLAASVRGRPGFGSLLAEGLFGVTAGLLTFLYPGITAIALLVIIAAWAILTGTTALMAAVALRKELSGEWLLPVIGVLSLTLGVMLLIWPAAGALAVAWMIGVYALMAGATTIALALRMRQFATEVRPA
jgi:uncharacterized membrane protein HdeD (DUF308 family)